MSGWSFIRKSTVAPSSTSSFKTIQTPSGTSPVATSPTDVLTLAAGSGITITGDATTDTITISASGIATPVSVGNGGWGQSMTMQTVATNGSHTALTPGLIKMTGTTGVVIYGITASATSTLTVLYNASANNMTVAHQNALASASNRIITPTAASISIRPLHYALFFYDTVQSRNVLIDVNMITGATSPLLISSTGVISVQSASSVQAGALSSSDWNIFNNKIGGSGAANAVPYFTGTSTVSADLTKLSWQPTKHHLGVGVSDTDSAATVHAKSDTGQGTTNATSNSAGLVAFPLPVVSPTVSAVQSTPHLGRMAVTSATQNFGATGYTDILDAYDFNFVQGVDVAGTINWSKVQTAAGVGFTEGGTTNSYGIDISFTPVNGLETPDAWLVIRTINGGAADYKVTTASSFTDDNTGWGSDPRSVYWPDFIANNSTIAFDFYGKKTTLAATSVYSVAATNTGMTDDNSGNAYTVLLTYSGGEADNYVLSTNAFGGFKELTGGSGVFDESNAGANSPPSPTSYGYVSDGTILNRSYNAYNKAVISGADVYSTTALTASTTDPNDGLNYVVQVSATAADTVKVINGNVGGSLSALNSITFYDDGIQTFPGDSIFTPTSVYAPAFLYEMHSPALGGLPAVIKSIDASGLVKVSFRNSTDAEYGYISADPSALIVRGGESGATLNLSATTSTATVGAGVFLGQTTTTTLDATSEGKLTWGGADRVKWNTSGVTVGGSTGSAITLIKSATATLNFPSIAATGGTQDLTITVTGAVVGDTVSMGLPAAPDAGVVFNAFVSAANTVTIRATNTTAGAIDPASASYRVTVTRF